MDEYQFPGSNGAETFEEGAETMETEEGAGAAGPDETQEILRSIFGKWQVLCHFICVSGPVLLSLAVQTS